MWGQGELARRGKRGSLRRSAERACADRAQARGALRTGSSGPSTARCHVDTPNKTPTHMPEEGDVDPGSHLSRGASPELTPVGEAELSKMRRLLKWQIMACASTAADRAFACEAAGWHAVHTPRTHTGAHDRVHIARIAAAGRRELHGVRLGAATED